MSARTAVLFSLAALLLLAAPLRARSEEPAGVTASQAFEMLQKLAGTWEGKAGADGTPARVVYRVASNGSVVMETLFPGSPHEMISMYHRDGPDLVMTHYCAAGNQPRMRLDPKQSTARTLVFDFTGGTNVDPKKDGHIHSGRIVFTGEHTLEAAWNWWENGAPAHENAFALERKRD